MTIEAGAHNEYPHVEQVITDLQLTLFPLHISDDVAEQVVAADCEIRGVRYFNKLFSSEPDVTPEERLTSAYLGATAYGNKIARQRAYSALYGMQTIQVIPSLFINEIDVAIKNERRVPNYEHLRRLEAASKQLGKPVLKRTLGNLATQFIARGYAR